MRLEKTAKSTLSAFELDVGDEFIFTLADGSKRTIKLLKSWAGLDSTTLKKIREPEPGAFTVLRCHCRISIDGTPIELIRWIGNDRSFYEPWEFFGLRLWFDANQELFEYLTQNHGGTQPSPKKQARFAIQDATLRICPPLLHPWCPLPDRGLRISDCYYGTDCWLGPYFGADAHGGLDINHPAGTSLWTPFALDDHFLFDRLEDGKNNNRWRGIRTWEDGTCWTIQTHHILKLIVKERTRLDAGVPFALGAGALNGSHEHSHFFFAVKDPEDEDPVMLDPWILFWQMYRDRSITTAHDHPYLT